MFDFLSWGHLLVIGLAALFIFGPERLPTLARDAADGLNRMRSAIAAAREQMGGELGEDFAELRDLDLRRYHPQTFIREQLLGEGAPPPPVGQRPTGDDAATRAWWAGRPTAAGASGSAAQRDRSLPPPFDPDAT